MKKFAGIFLLLVPVCLFAEDIPLIGLDPQGNVVERRMPREDYVRQMSDLVASLEETTFPVLDGLATMRTGDSDRPWSLTSLTLGVGLNLTVGIGPWFSLGIAPTVALIFSDSKDPINP